MDELIKNYAAQIGRRLIALAQITGITKKKLDEQIVGQDAIKHFFSGFETKEKPAEPSEPKTKKIK